MFVLAYFPIPLEWSYKSGRDICFIRYHKKTSFRTVTENVYHRLPVMAKMIGNFILAVGLKMSQVEIMGFSLGGLIGSRVCRYLHMETGQKVKFLLGKKQNTHISTSNE